jgi:hypothetical protein
MPPACPTASPVELSRGQLKRDSVEQKMPPALPAARGEADSSRWLLQTRPTEHELPVEPPAGSFENLSGSSITGQAPPARFGLWNRVFGPVQTLTFINLQKTLDLKSTLSCSMIRHE